jgi:type I restriction enzyme S subunit
MSAIMALSGAINQNLAAVVCGPRLVSPYLHHSLGCAYEYIREYGRGGQQAALNCEVLRGVLVAVPPREEQDAIVREVDKAAERFDALIDEARRAIELLQERRAALITAAVTGQIDVRGLA